MPPKQPSAAALVKQIASVEAGLLADLSDPNNLLSLISLARHTSPEVVHKAIWALHRCFIPLISSGRVGGLVSADLSVRAEESASGKEVKIWVRERLVEYLQILSGLLRDSEPALRVGQAHERNLSRTDKAELGSSPTLFSPSPSVDLGRAHRLLPNRPRFSHLPLGLSARGVCSQGI
jgi:hypothetical protein